MEKPQYLLKNIESNPRIHKPRKLSEKDFKKQISELSSIFNEKISELRNVKKDLSEAKKKLKRAKDHLEYIEKESRNFGVT